VFYTKNPINLQVQEITWKGTTHSNMSTSTLAFLWWK